MRNTVQFTIPKPKLFRNQLIDSSRVCKNFCLLENNSYTEQNKYIGKDLQRFDWMVGFDSLKNLNLSKPFGAFEEFQQLISDNRDYVMGGLSYDLKNDVEPHLTSQNIDGLDMPELMMFIPRYVCFMRDHQLIVEYAANSDTEESVKVWVETVQKRQEIRNFRGGKVSIQQRLTRNEYLQKLNKIAKHIQRGDIYEINFCQEFYASNTNIDPYELFVSLDRSSPNPFSAFLKSENHFVLSASPERYLKKSGKFLYAQPIKGTSPRSDDEETDAALALQLLNDEKERGENVMIVDLCRNDLSKVAERNSVEVMELFGIYKFPQVHQMISTIRANQRKDTSFMDVMKACFPMGSMTGAPKIRAMEIIEELEVTKRGMYSGAIGYVHPNGDFDFNVVIRSILYNAHVHYLSFQVGGAITSLSNGEKEYEECLLKAKAMFNILGVDSNKEYGFFE